MPNVLLLPELREMLAENDETALRAVVNELHPATVADFSEGLDVEETWQLLGHAPIDRQAEVLAFYPAAKQVEMVEGAGRDRIARLLEAMPHDDRVDLLKRLDDEVVESFLPLVTKADRADMRRLLSYPEQSAGAVMTTDYASLPAEATVAEAITELRRQAPERETIYYVYVVDEDRRLIGFVSLQDLILARPTALVADIMHRDVICARVDEDREAVARKLAEYDFIAIPIVDDQYRLVGIVTFDDVADVLEAEVTEDFHLTAAVAPLVRGYAQSNPWSLYRRRVGWLVILVFVNLFSSGVIAAYEDTLKTVIALAFFLPLLIDSGGNTGSQAATLIVRALATEEIGLGEWLRVVLKELAVGAALGATMAAASFVLGAFRGGVEVGLIVAVSMFSIVVLTNLIGVLLPFALTRLRLDPAVASSPLITTVADAAGLLIYFGVATWTIRLMGTF
jgi:magnesium transporter